jgi:hypothetical protein
MYVELCFCHSYFCISHLVHLQSDEPVFELSAAFGVVQQQMTLHNGVSQFLELAAMEVLALLQTATQMALWQWWSDNWCCKRA